MDKRIYKYSMEPNEAGEVLLKMPGAAIVLEIQPQPGQGLQLWALVDLAQPQETRKFVQYMTGQPLPSYPGEHVATLQFINPSEPAGITVLHVFEVPTHGAH